MQCTIITSVQWALTVRAIIHLYWHLGAESKKRKLNVPFFPVCRLIIHSKRSIKYRERLHQTAHAHSRTEVRHVKKANLIVLVFLRNIYRVGDCLCVEWRPANQLINCRKWKLYSLMRSPMLFSLSADTNCTYTFHATPNEQVTIVFDHFKVKADNANVTTGGAYGYVCLIEMCTITRRIILYIITPLMNVSNFTFPSEFPSAAERLSAQKTGWKCLCYSAMAAIALLAASVVSQRPDRWKVHAAHPAYVYKCTPMQRMWRAVSKDGTFSKWPNRISVCGDNYLLAWMLLLIVGAFLAFRFQAIVVVISLDRIQA